MGRHHNSHNHNSMDHLDQLTRKGQETLGLVRNFINNFNFSSTEENTTVFGITLASIFLLILIFDKFNYHGGRWTARLCKLNILAIGASLVSIKYKFIPGILPAVFITGVDVIFCSVYSLRYFSSLLLNSLKGILALFVAAVAMIYGEALLYFLRRNNVL